MRNAGLVLLALVAFAAVAQGADRRLLEDHKDEDKSKSSDDKKKTVSGWKQCGGTNNCDSKDKKKQCDGKQWKGYECEKDYECKSQNDWFWQCMPKEQTQSADTSETPRKLKDNEIKRYEQCGGSSGACSAYGCMDCAFPGKVCEPGYKCKRDSASYWQCDKKDKVKGDVKYCKAPPKLVKTFEEEAQDYDLEDLLKSQKKEEPKEEKKKDEDKKEEKEEKSEIDIVIIKKEEKKEEPKKEEKKEEEKEEEEEEKELTFDESTNIKDILGDKAAGVKRCNEGTVDNEIDGEFMEAIFLEPTENMYGACCDACLKEAGCQGFQVNLFSNTTNTCEMFSSVKDVMPATGVTMGMVLLPNEVSVAGK